MGNTAVQFLSPTVRIVLGVVVVAALSRYLGVRGLGAYALIFAYVLIIAGVFNDVGLATVCLREISASPSRVPTLLTSAALLQLLVAAITYGLLATTLLLVGYPTEIKLGILIFGLTVFLTPLDILVLPFQAQLRMARLVGPALLAVIVNFVLTIIAILLHGSLVVLVLAATVASLSQYLWIGVLATQIEWAAPSLRPWRFLVKESLPLAMQSMLTSILQQAPVLALSGLGLAAVGLFNAANRVPQQLVVFPLAMRATTFPIMSDSWINDRRHFAQVIDAAIGISMLAGVPITVLAIGFAPLLMPALFGPGFEGAVVPFQLLMGVVATLFPGIVVAEALIAARHQRTFLFLMTATFPLLILGLAVLVPAHGASGAALSLLAYYAVLYVSTVIAARWRLGDALGLRPLISGAVCLLAGLTMLWLTSGPASRAGAIAATLVAALLLSILERKIVRRLVAGRQSANPFATWE